MSRCLKLRPVPVVGVATVGPDEEVDDDQGEPVTQASSTTVSLLQAGLLIGLALGARLVVGRRVPIDAVPHLLQHRVAVMNRLCPWLLVAVLAVIAGALAVQLTGS